MRNIYAFFIIFALILGLRQSAAAQCSEMTFVFEHYEPCKFRLTVDNANDVCYTEIRLTLEQGTFATWNVNTAAGFEAQVISPSEIWITHTSGMMPFGSFVPILFELPPGLTTPIYVGYINACPPGTGCELFPAPVLESCPDPQDASISGVKYVECGGLPYLNQPTVAGWPIQLLDANGILIAETVTDNTGTYGFYDLPAGSYEIREADSSSTGWTANVPPTGMYAVTVIASQQLVRNFGNCPTLSNISGLVYATCDSSLYVDQPTLSGWLVTLLDASGATIAEALTDNNGAYVFADLPPGNYWVKLNVEKGWTPNIPAKGKYFANINLLTNTVLRFGVCEMPCECDQDLLLADAAKGFALIRDVTSCKTCFSPLALKHCDDVTWTIDGGPAIGASEGSASFCHTFPAAGTHTITMTVVRRDSDGNICAEATYSKDVSVTCGSNSDCTNSAFGNPGFSEGAVAGGINTVGGSAGWYGPCGEPIVVEGETGSNDGWTIDLTGYLDSADVLASQEPMCANKGSGTIALGFGIKENGIKGTLHIELYQGPDFEMNDCDGISCFELASIDLSTLDTGWLELELPYDLSEWGALDTCPDGELLVRPAIYVTSGASALLPGAERTRVKVDNFCMPQSTCEVGFVQCPEDMIVVDCDGTDDEFIIGYPVTQTHTGDCFSTQLVQISGPVAGSTVPVGSYLVEFQAQGYDASNNPVSTDICSIHLQVQPDIQPPVFTFCPPDISIQGTYDDVTGDCIIPVFWLLPVAEDAPPCGPGNLLPLTSNFSPGTFFTLGTHTVVYLAEDNSTNQTTCSFEINVTCTTGTGEPGNTPYPLKIHPNPTTNNFTVELPQPAIPGMQLRIAGIAGNTLLTLNLPPGTTTEIVPSDDLPGGIYLLQILSDERVLGIQKLVKL